MSQSKVDYSPMSSRRNFLLGMLAAPIATSLLTPPNVVTEAALKDAIRQCWEHGDRPSMALLREDLADTIYSISPADTPFLRALERSGLRPTIEWQKDTLV